MQHDDDGSPICRALADDAADRDVPVLDRTVDLGGVGAERKLGSYRHIAAEVAAEGSHDEGDGDCGDEEQYDAEQGDDAPPPIRARARQLDGALSQRPHPDTFTPLEVPQNRIVISMSLTAMSTMLARIARPAARPTPSGPPLAV